MNYYIFLFQNPKVNNQKSQKKYEKIKSRIMSANQIIMNMKEFFCNLQIDKYELNINLYLFILFLTENFNLSVKEKQFILNMFEKEFLKEKEKINDIIILPGFKIQSKKNNHYIISNKFDAKEIDGNDYVLKNLVYDFQVNPEIPLDILLLRNHSLSFYNDNNFNIINDEDLFPYFKEYFYKLISSKLVKEALTKSHNKNIIELINSEIFPGFKLDEKYVKTVPLYEFMAEGFTNKDFLCTFVSYFPFLVQNTGEITSEEQYDTLRNIIYAFNIEAKMILLLHEVLIHLGYGYLNKLTEGEISNISPKATKHSKNNNSNNEFEIDTNSSEYDGGSFFEEILFGEKVTNLRLQSLLILLDEDCFNYSVDEFQKKIHERFDKNHFKKKKLKGFLKRVLTKYKINVDVFDFNIINVNMRNLQNNFLYMERKNNIIDCISIIGRPNVFTRKDIENKGK